MFVKKKLDASNFIEGLQVEENSRCKFDELMDFSR